MSEVKVTNNVPEIRQKFVAGIRDVTEWAADSMVEYAKEEAPVSDNNAPGHIHLVDRIRSVWRNQYRKDAVSEAEYSFWVNNGTTRMAANPFWDRALERVRAEYVGEAQRRVKA